MTEKPDTLRWENMMAGIRAQVPFLRHGPETIYAALKETLRPDRLPSRIYLTGCGDSWYCGMATRFAFEAWSGISTEAVQALEFSRYLVRYAPADSMVIAVSNSGRVSRTIEAVVQANRRGIYTVGCTSNFEEGLSQEARAVVDLSYTKQGFAPGTTSYMASLVVEYCLAVYLAELSGRLSAEQARARLGEISALADGMERTISENESTLRELGTQATLENLFVFIGGGPNYGTAFFSMAKLIEAARINAVGQELEEWAHEQYFITGSHAYTFVIAPPGASVDRAREQMYAINQMGSRCIAICDPDDRETQAQADVVLAVYGSPDELLSPLLYCVPGQLFAFHFAASKDLKMFGFDDERIKAVNWRQIFGSHILRD